MLAKQAASRDLRRAVATGTEHPPISLSHKPPFDIAASGKREFSPRLPTPWPKAPGWTVYSVPSVSHRSTESQARPDRRPSPPLIRAVIAIVAKSRSLPACLRSEEFSRAVGKSNQMPPAMTFEDS